MRRALRSQLTLLLFFSAVVLPAAHAVAQEQAGTLTFVCAAAEPQTLLLDTSDATVRSGQLDVLLRNESKEAVTPVMDYILAGSGRVLEVESEAPASPPSPEDPVRVSLAGEPHSIPSLETAKLSLSVSVAKGTRPYAAAGRLVVGAGPGQNVTPATMTISPVLTPPWRWQGAVIEPAAITINHTNWLPGFLPVQTGGWDGAGRKVTVHGISTDTLEGANHSAVLSSGTGGTATLAFDPDEDSGTPATGTLRVKQISGVGKYDGSLLLDPEASNSPKLTVTVNARDFFLWPLLTLLVGVLLAWALLWWRDTRRPKDLVLKRIKEIHLTNEENTPDPRGPEPLYTYSDLFPKPPEGYPGVLDWRNCKFMQKPRTTRELYCNVIAIRSREELDNTQKQVNDLAARVDIWKPTYDATKTLYVALENARGVVSDSDNALVSDPENIPLLQETEKLLEPRNHPPTAADAEALLGKLREQTDMLNSFIEGSKLKKVLQPLYDSLLAIEDSFEQPSERQELHRSDPDALYRAYLLPATTKAKLTEGNAIGRLRQAQYVLQYLSNAYSDGAAEGDGSTASLDATEVQAASTQAALTLGGVPSFLRTLTDHLRDTRTPGEILTSVRVHDLLDFAVSALLTSLAYLLALTYIGSIGTWQHYLAAFVAGASGSLAINWALLPWARSYIGGSTSQPIPGGGTAPFPPGAK